MDSSGNSLVFYSNTEANHLWICYPSCGRSGILQQTIRMANSSPNLPMPAGMRAALLMYLKLWFFVEKPILHRLNYCPAMRGNVFFPRIDFCPLRLRSFLVSTTTIMAFSSLRITLPAPVIDTECNNFALSHTHVPTPFSFFYHTLR